MRNYKIEDVRENKENKNYFRQGYNIMNEALPESESIQYVFNNRDEISRLLKGRLA